MDRKRFFRQRNFIVDAPLPVSAEIHSLAATEAVASDLPRLIAFGDAAVVLTP
jgi:hypothetical protein